MPVKARRFFRKMRGGAQAHLLEAEDGCHYVVKFRNNPQHRRILVNEWISSVFLHYLRISAPEVALIELTPEFLESNPEVHFQLGSKQIAVESGWHFGSRFPGDPKRSGRLRFSARHSARAQSRMCRSSSACMPLTSGWPMPTRVSPSFSAESSKRMAGPMRPALWRRWWITDTCSTAPIWTFHDSRRRASISTSRVHARALNRGFPALARPDRAFPRRGDGRSVPPTAERLAERRPRRSGTAPRAPL